MYVLELDSSERKYLLSLLKAQHISTAKRLVMRLTSSEDVFGVVMWGDEDIAFQLREQAVADSPENIRAVRESSLVRHIGDRMTEHGWDVLEAAVLELE